MPTIVWILSSLLLTSFSYQPVMGNSSPGEPQLYKKDGSFFNQHQHLTPKRLIRQAHSNSYSRSSHESRESGGRLIYSGITATGPPLSFWNTTNTLPEIKIKEIFRLGNNSNDQPELVVFNNSNTPEAGDVFDVQRTSDGRLNVLVNGTRIPPLNIVNASSITTPSPFVRDDKILNQSTSTAPRPKCASANQVFCSQVEDYPSQQVENLLRNNFNKYEELFGEDLLSQKFDLSTRVDIPGEESLCSSSERLVYPQVGLTRDDSWRYIINQANYTQGVRIEECENPGQSCAMTDSFPNRYTTECRQNYIYRQLLAVNAQGRVVKDLFKLPSCCKCIIKLSSGRQRRHTGN